MIPSNKIAQTLFDNRYACINHSEMMHYFETARKICFVAAVIFTIAFLSIERGASLLFIAIVLDITLNLDKRREEQTRLVRTTLEDRAAEIDATNQHLASTNQQFQETVASLGTTTDNYGRATEMMAKLAATLSTTVTACEQAVNRLTAHTLS